MKISIAGIGNLLMGDDGVGIHAVEILNSMSLPDHVEVFDCDSNTNLLLEAITGRDKAVIIDAYENGDEPGTITRLEIDPSDLPESDLKLSLHDMGFFEGMRFGLVAGYAIPKEVVVIGIEPESMACEIELSPKVKEALPRVIEKVISEI